MVDLKIAPIAYGEANTASFKDATDDLYYQADRIQNRILLDFGEVKENQRVGMQLKDNNILTPCLLHSIQASANSTTDDTLVWEIHTELNSGVKNRISLQYIDRNEAPYAHPEYILLPEYTIYLIPSQDSFPRIVLEPINLMIHATKLV